MLSTAWKAHERTIAKRLGGKRTGPQGRMSVDVAHPLYSIECKHRKELPGWMQKAMLQAVGNCKPEQLPMVVLHALGTRHDTDWVCVRLKDWQEWYGEIEQE